MRKLRFFDLQEIRTLEDLKAMYKKLAVKLHPDVSGYDSTKDFQDMGNEYDMLFEQFKTKHINFNTKETYEKDYGEIKETYKNIINKYIKYIKRGLTIEVIGRFIYIGGEILNPKAKLSKKDLILGETIRTMLKLDKFHYSNQKAKWCFSEQPYRSLKKHSWDMNRIRNSFVSTQVTAEDEEEEQKKITA